MSTVGQVSCLITKALIPFVEREVGPEGVAAILKTAGRSREWLIAEYNFLPLPVADRLVRVAMDLMHETDEERWARRFGDDLMDWKPSREERGWGGAYTMSLGSPRAIFGDTRRPLIGGSVWTRETLEFRRSRATFRITIAPGVQLPRWMCTVQRVGYERYPTNWGLPRAVVRERSCVALGDPSCVWDVRWKNPPLGAPFWVPSAAGAVSSLAALGFADGEMAPWGAAAPIAILSTLTGVAIGFGLLKARRHREAARLLRIQREEILYSSGELERKFRDLETKVEQLTLLIDLSNAVNATLDSEKIYEHALQRLVHGMEYQGAHLFLVDRARGVVRGHKMVVRERETDFVGFETVELPLTVEGSMVGKVAVTGMPVRVDDVEATDEPVHRPTARALGIGSSVMVPLRVKDRVFGVLSVGARETGRFGESDVELLSAVANHVAVAVDRAESFQTIEDLTRGLEDKVRVRTEQLRAANEELQAAYRDLQQTQMQLIQREKMASVGQLVAGVAHELNNPIGFVYSNTATLEDFVRRLRAMLGVYRARTASLPEGDRAEVGAEWERLKIDYALKYLDAMTQGIREGAERARKIVRDLRVFARSDENAWQPVDLHEELESSLTLLNHLLEGRVTVHRKFADLPPVECVRSQIDQVFLNILANAAQAIQGPGEITIETRREDGAAIVAITDTGRGIAPEAIGRIFDPFFTTKPVGEGTGLGLSISYEIVGKHGGEIHAESQPGRGATFTIRLPLAPRIG
jgi:signal transduction histidine kinase